MLLCALKVVDGSFFLELAPSMLTSAVTVDGQPILSLATCVAACAVSSSCASATFDYYIALEGQVYPNGTDKKDHSSCLLWNPTTSGSISTG
jgi:hypothetical protein